MTTEKERQTDFVVVGSGIAGTRAAIELAGAGQVLVLSKDEAVDLTDPGSRTGIAATLCGGGDNSLRLRNTLRMGDGLSRQEAVRILAEEGPKRVEELIEWSSRLDKPGAKPGPARESGHSRHAAHAHGGSAEQEIRKCLTSRATSSNTLEIEYRALATELLVEDRHAVGVMYLDEKAGAFKRVRARGLLLATGGLGQVYKETTNPPAACGDGISLAYQAGVLLSDMEFIQFHPTTLYARGCPRFVLPEALLQAGAKLRNVQLERFMPRYHEAGELASPEVVARAVVSEMQKYESECVYLDLTGLNTEQTRKRFPGIVAICSCYNIDIASDMVPVRPAAHFAVGGIATDLEGVTTVEGLYAAGEVAATGVHGANRLEGNSVLESLVYGVRAARAMIEARPPFRVPAPAYRPPRTSARSHGGRHASTAMMGENQASSLMNEIRNLMWEKVGIIRQRKELGLAIRRLEALSVAEEDSPDRAYYEARSMLQVARVIARCAVGREESRGAHYRADFPLKKESRPALHSYISEGSPLYFA